MHSSAFRTLLVSISGLIMIGLIGLIDWLTAQQSSLYVFYAVPIFLGAWLSGRVVGFVLCLISVITWTFIDLNFHEGPLLLVLWNAGLRLGLFIGIAIVISSLRSSLDREKAFASIDFLTGLPNRRAFLEIAEQHRQSAIRHKRPLTIAYIDLDDFKIINDQAGHDKGDMVLKEIGSMLKNIVRKSDTVARIGGDEFVALFTDTDFEAGRIVLDKMKTTLSNLMRERGWPISVSIGAVTYDEYSPEIKEMIRNADRLMYAAKAAGKNRIHQERR